VATLAPFWDYFKLVSVSNKISEIFPVQDGDKQNVAFKVSRLVILNETPCILLRLVVASI